MEQYEKQYEKHQKRGTFVTPSLRIKVKDVKDLNCSGLGLGSIPVDACRDSISELLAVKRNGKKKLGKKRQRRQRRS